MKLTILVKYRTPSLNVTKRQHWTEQMREKRRAFAALESALRATGSGHLIQTILPEAVKDLLDGCVHAGLLAGDEPWRIVLETTQKKVRSFAEEKTLIEIET